MTLPRLQRLSTYWREFPPMHVLVRYAVMGAPREKKMETRADLLTAVGVIGGTVKPLAALPYYIQRDMVRDNVNA